MKNLATCSPREFMVQTNLIRKSVEKWLKATDIMAIRRRKPDLPPVPEMPEVTTPEEKARILEAQATAIKERDAIIRQHAVDNAFAIIDAAFEDHTDETLEVLALVCFVPVSEVNEHPMKFYMQSIRELIEDSEVMAFFTSLVRLAQMSGT